MKNKIEDVNFFKNFSYDELMLSINNIHGEIINIEKFDLSNYKEDLNSSNYTGNSDLFKILESTSFIKICMKDYFWPNKEKLEKAFVLIGKPTKKDLKDIKKNEFNDYSKNSFSNSLNEYIDVFNSILSEKKYSNNLRIFLSDFLVSFSFFSISLFWPNISWYKNKVSEKHFYKWYLEKYKKEIEKINIDKYSKESKKLFSYWQTQSPKVLNNDLWFNFNLNRINDNL